MPSAPDILADAVERALRSVVGADRAGPAMLRPCADTRFGDYQANGIMAVAKRLGQNPRALADKVIAQLQVADVSEPPTLAGAGFINFRLKPDFVAQQINVAAHDERLGVPTVAQPKTVVVDFSSPNVAKPMHVGHIRSTIIGDSLTRVMRFLGHRVTTDNHIGDWCTQFGVLISGWKAWKSHPDKSIQTVFENNLKTNPIGALENLYKETSAWLKTPSRGFLAYSDPQSEVARLQRGEESLRKILGANNVIVKLHPEDYRQIISGNNRDNFFDESFSKMKFESDDRIEKGGCIVETEIGNVDGRVSSRLNELKRYFVPANPGSEE